MTLLVPMMWHDPYFSYKPWSLNYVHLKKMLRDDVRGAGDFDFKICLNKFCSLTHFFPMHPFSTLRKQKTVRCPDVFWG